MAKANYRYKDLTYRQMVPSDIIPGATWDKGVLNYDAKQGGPGAFAPNMQALLGPHSSTRSHDELCTLTVRLAETLCQRGRGAYCALHGSGSVIAVQVYLHLYFGTTTRRYTRCVALTERYGTGPVQGHIRDAMRATGGFELYRVALQRQ